MQVFFSTLGQSYHCCIKIEEHHVTNQRTTSRAQLMNRKRQKQVTAVSKPTHWKWNRACSLVTRPRTWRSLSTSHVAVQVSSAISATPATQRECGCHQVPRLPRNWSADVTKCHACHAKCHSVTGDQWDPSAPPDPAQCHKCHACHTKRKSMWASATLYVKDCVCVSKIVCDKVACQRLCVLTIVCNKAVVKDCVRQSCVCVCVSKIVCDKVVWQSCCVKDCVCVTKLLCERLCVWQSCVWQSCVWKIVCVCVLKIVCNKAVVKDCVRQSCVCVSKIVCDKVVWQSCCVKDCVCVTKLLCERLCVWQSCVWQSCVWKIVCVCVCRRLCVYDKVVVWKIVCVTKLLCERLCVCDKVVCDKVVCDKLSLCVSVCQRLRVTKLCVKDCVCVTKWRRRTEEEERTGYRTKNNQKQAPHTKTNG